MSDFMETKFEQAESQEPFWLVAGRAEILSAVEKIVEEIAEEADTMRRHGSDILGPSDIKFFEGRESAANDILEKIRSLKNGGIRR